MVKKTLKKENDSITIKQIRSGAGKVKSQIATLKGLGLNKINKVSVLQDTPEVRGMLEKVKSLVTII